MRYAASTIIDATPDAVWTILTDASAYALWEPNITKVDGAIASGAKITIHTQISPGRAFPVKVTDLTAPRRMEWSGGMPLGLFRGVRSFTLTPDVDGTRVDVEEQFSGPLLQIITKSMPDLTDSFNDFVTALKARVEG